MNLDRHTGELRLHGPLGIDNAHDLRTAFIALMESPTPHVTVDLGGVTEVDLVAIQIFQAGVLSTRSFNKRITFREVPVPVQARLSLVGVTLP